MYKWMHSQAHAYTHIETHMCLEQCWKAANDALSLKAVYCDRHTAFSPVSVLALHLFPLSLALAHLNFVVAHFHMLLRTGISPCCFGSFVIALAFALAIWFIMNVFLVVRHSSDSHKEHKDVEKCFFCQCVCSYQFIQCISEPFTSYEI